MSDPNQPSTPPGWYPDGQGGQRWWDGNQWTEHTQPPAAPAPSAPAAPATPSAPAAPADPGPDMPTQVAPNRAAGYPQPSAQPQQPVYGAPAGQSGFGQPAGFGQPPFGGPGGSGGSGGSGGNGKLIAIIGGAVGAVLLVVIVLFVLFKVVLGGSAEDVASDYLEATGDGDFEEVCELSSKDYQKERLAEVDADDCGDVQDAVAESFEEQGIPGYDDYDDLFDDIEYEFEIGDVEEKEKTATVEYTYSVTYQGDEDFGEFFNEDDVDAELTLVKEDGDWKVDADSGS